MKKRVISMIIVAIMLLTMLPAFAFAEDVQEDEQPGLYYCSVTLNGNEATHNYSYAQNNISIIPKIGQYTFGDFFFGTKDEVKSGKCEPLSYSDLEFPKYLDVLKDETYNVLAIGATRFSEESENTDVIYRKDDKEYRLSVNTSLPSVGCYSAPIANEENYIMDSFVLTEDNRTLYICSREPDSYKIVEIKSLKSDGNDISDKFEVKPISDENGDCYKITAIADETIPSMSLGVEIVYQYKFNETEEWSQGYPTWEYVDIINNEPVLCLKPADWNQDNDTWYIPSNANSMIALVFSSGSCISGSFFYGTEESSAPVDLNKLQYDDSMLQIEKIDSVLQIKAIAYEGKTEIQYIDGDVTAKMPFEITPPSIGFYSSSAPSAETYISTDDSFTVTETNRTFYLCCADTEKCRIKSLEGIEGNGSDASGFFTVEECTDANGAIYYMFTAKSEAVVSGMYLRARCIVENCWGEEWHEHNNDAMLYIKNGEPSLIFVNAEWNDGERTWFVPDDREGTGTLYMGSDGNLMGMFFFGTGESKEPVAPGMLGYDKSILDISECDGVLRIEPKVYEGSAEIVYSAGDKPSAMSVIITPPSFGLYSSSVVSAETYLGSEVLVSAADDVFYFVAGNGNRIEEFVEIRSMELNRDVSDSFDITLSPNGEYLEFRPKTDSEGNLVPGGNYDIHIHTQFGDMWHSFGIVRSDLQPLSVPTELEWNTRYSWVGDDDGLKLECFDRMGSMSFKIGELNQNRYDVEVYRVGENGNEKVLSGGWGFDDMDHADHFSMSDFIYSELSGGKYIFRVKARGDGTKFRDSEWSAFSPEWTYTAPEARLASPDASSFDWVSDDNRIFSTWEHTGEDATGYYEVRWFFIDENGNKEQMSGSFDIRTDDRFTENGFGAWVSDEMLEAFGNHEIFFEVRAIPEDITQYRLSAWSGSSTALDINNITLTVNQKLDNLIPSDPGDPAPTVGDVQEALKDDTAELRVSMAADLSLSDGPSSGTLERIETLEKSVSDAVGQKIVAENTAPSSIQSIVDDVKMIGATLNFDEDSAVEGEVPTVTLVLDKPETGIVIDNQQHNAIQFSMKLEGAVDKDEAAENGQQLIVPIVISMPVPESINPNFLVILHKLHDGSIEHILPFIYQNAEGKWYARFVVDSFSDYAMVEYIFAFEETEVSKTEGDEPFILTASGNAEGSTVSYTSSDTEVAAVNAETGEVTVLKAGTTTITATATATAVYPEISASYELTVSAKENPPVIPPVSPDTGDDDDDDTDDVKSNPFVDVDEGDYFYDAVLWAVSGGITSGTDETHFSPDNVTSRAQMVTFLWRSAGCPEVETVMPFTDVAEGSYYEKAVLWALANGITTGVSENSFAPDASVTRAQAVTFLTRMAGVADKGEAMSHCFTDVSAEDYFNNAVAWAYENNITSGVTETTFAPNADCLRSQIVTFLWRYLVK